MCLGEVGQVLEVGPGGTAVVRSGQRTATVSLLTLEDPVAPGDWVLCHSGFALGRLTPREAAAATTIRTGPAAAAAAPATTAPPRKGTT